MSHRVTTETQIKDKELAASTLTKLGAKYSVSGNSILITSGPMANASIDLSTGRVTGDTDFRHSSALFGDLVQAYGESKYRAECAKQGVSVESRIVEKNGDIVLMCARALTPTS